jgi:hypothetical protein
MSMLAHALSAIVADIRIGVAPFCRGYIADVLPTTRVKAKARTAKATCM